MRNPVPTVDQSSLAGCAVAGIGFVDAEQRRTSDGDWTTMRRELSIDLQLAPCLGRRRARGFDQWARRRSPQEAERSLAGDGMRSCPNTSADAARIGAASRRNSWRTLSALTGQIGQDSQEKRIQLQAHADESKKNRDPERFAACANELAGLKAWAREGGCQLIYYDEAGFSASPPVQRAWSPAGCAHAVTPAHHQRVAVMGALDFARQRLYHVQGASTVNRETFIDFMEHLIPQIAKPVPTFIILDNARIHHGLDDSLTLRWMKEFNTFLCYLPPYSPELNMIEILWKQAKYHWREFATWSKETFRPRVSELLDGFSTKFQINFA